jgi:hypothetical protein
MRYIVYFSDMRYNRLQKHRYDSMPLTAIRSRT